MQHQIAQNCTAVSSICPVEDTIYGYTPSLPINAFFIAFFAVFALHHVIFGLHYRTYFFALALHAGCIAEAIGYAGRILLHNNVYSNVAFNIQISCLIFAPAFIAAGIYITLQHIVQTFGAQISRLPPKAYTIIFMLCDSFSLILQAVGGGLAGSSKGNVNQRNVGTDLMMVGIVIQVFTLIVFAGLVIDYAIRVKYAWVHVNVEGKKLAEQTSFKLFVAAVAIAFLAIFCRCVYRIAELSGGWASPIMRDEASYVVLEGFMMVIAVTMVSVFHPGWCFPAMGGRVVQVNKSEVKITGDSAREWPRSNY